LRTAIKEELLCADSTDGQLQASVQELIAERFSEMTAGLDSFDLILIACRVAVIRRLR
jgi:hypothetical protein